MGPLQAKVRMESSFSYKIKSLVKGTGTLKLKYGQWFLVERSKNIHNDTDISYNLRLRKAKEKFMDIGVAKCLQKRKELLTFL